MKKIITFRLTSLCVLSLAMFSLLASCKRDSSIDLLSSGLSDWVLYVNPEAGVPADSVFTFDAQNKIVKVSGNPFGYMRTKESYSNYTLHAEWRWVGEPTNSGIFSYIQLDPTSEGVSENGDKLWPKTIECQLMAGSAGDMVLLGDATIMEAESVNGIVKTRNSASTDSSSCEKPAGEWNVAEIVCKGNSITVTINGVLQNSCTAEMDHGHLALQSEGGPLEFRNVVLTPLAN